MKWNLTIGGEILDLSKTDSKGRNLCCHRRHQRMSGMTTKWKASNSSMNVDNNIKMRVDSNIMNVERDTTTMNVDTSSSMYVDKAWEGLMRDRDFSMKGSQVIINDFHCQIGLVNVNIVNDSDADDYRVSRYSNV